MFERIRLSIFSLALCVCLALPFAPGARSQQTLGGITGTVTDTSGGVLADTSVTLIGDQTTLTRTQKTNSSGSYEFVNLPIGTYTLTFTHDGFETQKIPSILVQANRTVSLNACAEGRPGGNHYHRGRNTAAQRGGHDERLRAG